MRFWIGDLFDDRLRLLTLGGCVFLLLIYVPLMIIFQDVLWVVWAYLGLNVVLLINFVLQTRQGHG